MTTEMVEEEERMVAERAAREQKEELEWKASAEDCLLPVSELQPPASGARSEADCCQSLTRFRDHVPPRCRRSKGSCPRSSGLKTRSPTGTS